MAKAQRKQVPAPTPTPKAPAFVQDDPMAEFVERMGLLCEAEQMPRIAGRLFGLFIVENGTFNLNEIARRLKVSRASISTNARMLADVGFLERVSVPGDRRDYYRLAPSPFERMLEGMVKRMGTIGEFLAESYRRFPPERAEARDRLRSYADFHKAAADAMRAVLRVSNKAAP